MTAAKTPFFLLTGFLGSGKTTLLNAVPRAQATCDKPKSKPRFPR